jgi:hypothetical protein
MNEDTFPCRDRQGIVHLAWRDNEEWGDEDGNDVPRVDRTLCQESNFMHKVDANTVITCIMCLGTASRMEQEYGA